MAMIGVKESSDCSFFGAEDESSEHLTSNCTAITDIRDYHFLKLLDWMGSYTLYKPGIIYSLPMTPLWQPDALYKTSP